MLEVNCGLNSRIENDSNPDSDTRSCVTLDKLSKF